MSLISSIYAPPPHNSRENNCQRKVEMSGFVQSENVRLKGLRQGWSGAGEFRGVPGSSVSSGDGSSGDTILMGSSGDTILISHRRPSELSIMPCSGSRVRK